MESLLILIIKFCKLILFYLGHSYKSKVLKSKILYFLKGYKFNNYNLSCINIYFIGKIRYNFIESVLKFLDKIFRTINGV